MNLLLAGLTVLVIGDSHIAYVQHTDFLITTLHDELMQRGATVYSYGVCGAKPRELLNGMKVPYCGFTFRFNDGKIRLRQPDLGPTMSLNELVGKFHPNLIVVVSSDTMANYKEPAMNKAWVSSEVTALARGIKSTGASCVWVGPTWGSEGGKYGKTYAKALLLSDYLSGIVAPCTYIDSLKMAKPGEWGTLDGMHLNSSGYQSWGSAIASEIVSSDILQKIRP